jgi:AcrR family transcriptional regulator
VPSETETEEGVNPPDDTTTSDTEPDTEVSEPETDGQVAEEENVVSEEEVVAIVEDIALTGITEELVSVLDSGDLSEEQVAEIVDAVLETIVAGEVTEEILDVLESDALTDEQVLEIVDAILEEEISEEAAVALATSAAVLESINAEQATEIFATVDAGALTEEAKSDITAAVQDAPVEVQEAFEEEIDVYGDGFDEYVPTGSEIPVGERRTLIAATAALATAAAAGAAGGSMGGGSGGSSGGSSGGNGSNNGAGKKPEEEGEGGGELVGLEEDEEKEPFTRNSIFKYLED